MRTLYDFDTLGTTTNRGYDTGPPSARDAGASPYQYDHDFILRASVEPPGMPCDLGVGTPSRVPAACLDAARRSNDGGAFLLPCRYDSTSERQRMVQAISQRTNLIYDAGLYPPAPLAPVASDADEPTIVQVRRAE